MKLGVLERMSLLSAMPDQESIVTMRTVHELRMALSLDDEEQKRAEAVQDGTRVRWEKEFEADVPLTMGGKAYILSLVEKLDKDKKVNEVLLDVYDRIKAETD